MLSSFAYYWLLLSISNYNQFLSVSKWSLWSRTYCISVYLGSHMNHRLNQFLKLLNFYSILYNNIVTYFPFPTHHSPYKWNVMLEIQSMIQNSNYNIPMIISYFFLQNKTKFNCLRKTTKFNKGVFRDIDWLYSAAKSLQI